MKTDHKYSFLIFLFLLLLFSRCGNEASEPIPPQKVTIADIWIGNVTDYDGDNYVSFFNLYFDLNINKGSKEAFVLMGIRFYDEADTATYFELFSTESFTIEGNTDDDVLYIGVELPSNDYPATGYDLLFLVLDSNNPESRLAEMSATNQEIFSNVPLEPAEIDNNIWIFDTWFDDEVDIDGDGYNSEAWLVFDVDEASGSGAEVYLDISYRESGATSFIPLVRTETFTVIEEADDPRGIRITDYYDFNIGSYDFRIDLKFAGYNIVEDWEDASTDADLSGVQLELSSEDIPQELSVWNAWRSAVVDNDLDSYYSSVVITIDIDVSYGEADVYMRVYYKPSTESTYTFGAETQPFHITGNSSNDDQSIEFWDFPFGLWDLKFEILFVGSGNVELTYDDTNDFDLNDVPLETVSEDTP